MASRRSTPIKEIVQYENDVYYYRKGKKEISLKTSDWDEAVKEYAIISVKAIGGHKASKLKMKDVFEDYLKYREDQLTQDAKEELKKIRERKKKRENNEEKKQA
jgi:hypothetical protein